MGIKNKGNVGIIIAIIGPFIGLFIVFYGLGQENLSIAGWLLIGGLLFMAITFFGGMLFFIFSDVEYVDYLPQMESDNDTWNSRVISDWAIETKTNRRIPISNKLKHEIWRRDNFTCQYCGRDINEVELEIDHILPVSNGGTNTKSNLQTLCFECNRSKGAK